VLNKLTESFQASDRMFRRRLRHDLPRLQGATEIAEVDKSERRSRGGPVDNAGVSDREQ